MCLLGSVRRKTPVTQARLRVVVGDRARIEKAIRELKIGEIELLSTDGSAQ